MKHVLKVDRWTLDSAGILVFAAGVAANFQMISDSGEKHPDRILAAAGIALLAYSVAVLFGMAVRKYIPSIRSWAWMSIAGAFFYMLVLVAMAIPHWMDHYRRFIEASGVTQSQYLLDYLPGILGLFAFWATSGAVVLIVMRLVFVGLRKLNNDTNR